MFSGATVLLPRYRRAAKELAERQLLGLDLEACNSKMVMWGAVLAVMILGLCLGMVILRGGGASTKRTVSPPWLTRPRGIESRNSKSQQEDNACRSPARP
ncbi:unnamed protein product, partial [Ectocarpus sp. 12 AP-2014]